MKISELKLNDSLIEKHPMGYTMPVRVCEEPIERDGVWMVETIAPAKYRYLYRQLPNGDILNVGNQITTLVYGDERTSLNVKEI